MNLNLGFVIAAFVLTLFALFGVGPSWLLAGAVLCLCVSGLPLARNCS